MFAATSCKFPTQFNREYLRENRNQKFRSREIYCILVAVHFSHTFPAASRKHELFLLSITNEESEMVGGNGAWTRQGEGFRRAHHEA